MFRCINDGVKDLSHYSWSDCSDHGAPIAIRHLCHFVRGILGGTRGKHTAPKYLCVNEGVLGFVSSKPLFRVCRPVITFFLDGDLTSGCILPSLV